MLSGAGLAWEFWAKVVGTACYLKNRSPISGVVEKTLHEVWPGKKPCVAHIRVFGCDSFFHVLM